jgi:hypothetical protein
MHGLVILAGFVVGALLVLGGIMTIGLADFFLATRETAINTRKDAAAGSQYGGLKTASVIVKIFGFLYFVAALVAIIAGFLSPM